ncbi:MAG TPA: alpha/beta fold hydrolase [Anaeromyxobacteraceae bacterium]|nr:alpha/beta fold hydrolase [Anaeromyxobacteraceae bacterium]
MSRENSTNGRSQATVPAALRAAFALLGRVAPGTAGAMAERLFLTPPRHAAPAREREALAGAVPFEVRLGRTALRAWRLGEGPAVLLCHGWGGRGAQLLSLGEPLREAGFSLVTFDAPAHGRSGGRLASVPVFADAIAAMARQAGARAAVAHSMGGAALALAILRGLPVDAGVVVSTPRSPWPFFQAFGDALGLPPGIRDAARARLERRVGFTADAFDLPRMATGAPPVPLLVVHDRGDAEVPFADGADIAAAWPGARLLATEGLGHRRILRDPAVAGAAAAFVLEHSPRCACGRLARAAGACDGCQLSAELYDREARAA